MKKVLSIVLLMVFLFNVGGYYIVFWGLRIQNENELNDRLDANLYGPEETIEVKIAISLPYPVQSHDFQRVHGRFEHNGEFYKLVKQKFQNDTVYVVYIRDHATRELVSTMADYVELTQGFQGTDNSHKALNYLSKLVKDFYARGTIAFAQQFGSGSLEHFPERPDVLLQLAIPVDTPPPRL